MMSFSFSLPRVIKKLKRAVMVYLPRPNTIAYAGKSAYIEFPVFMSSPKDVVMEEYTRLRQGSKLLNSEGNVITIKKYTVISMNCMIVTNNHKSTVGIPQILLGISGINDVMHNTTIHEDVWIGANVSIICVDNIGRGAIVGACSTVTKDIPPYALVVGSPARIVGVKFSIDEIVEHEKVLYAEEERLSREYLEQLFETHYKGIKTYGVRTVFDDGQIDRLRYCMQQRGFSDDGYLEKVKGIK